MTYVLKNMTEDDNITLLDNWYYNAEDAAISIKKINEDYERLQKLYKSHKTNFEQDSRVEYIPEVEVFIIDRYLKEKKEIDQDISESIKLIEELITYLTEQKEKILDLQDDYLQVLFYVKEEC